MSKREVWRLKRQFIADMTADEGVSLDGSWHSSGLPFASPSPGKASPNEAHSAVSGMSAPPSVAMSVTKKVMFVDGSDARAVMATPPKPLQPVHPDPASA